MRIRIAGPAGAAALALLLALGGCDSVEERVARHYARGMELLEQSQPEKARLEFRNALRLDENHAPSRFEIARAFEADLEFRAALSNYRLVTELDPDHVGARIRLARLLLVSGQGEEARTQIAAALALAPADAEALATKAAIEHRLGDAAAAVESARAALAIDPVNGDAHVVLVTERLEAGDYDAALALADAVLARDPVNRPIALLKLKVLEDAGRTEALDAYLVDLTAAFPEEAGFRRALAQLRFNAGDVEGAETQLRAVADADAADDEAALGLAGFLFTHRSPDAARAELEGRIAARGGRAAAWPLTEALVDLETRVGRLDEATAILRDVAAVDPEGASGREARARLAAIELEAGRTAEAKALVEAVLAADAQHVGALSLRAEMAIDAEDPQAAIRDLRAALDSDPDNLRLLLLSARAHERDGSPDLAGERLATAARVSNFAPEVAARYAAFLRGRGQPVAAETVLAEAVRRAPQNAALLAALAQLRVELENWAGAEEMASALAAIDTPGARAAAQQVRAGILNAQGRTEEGTAILQSLVESGEAVGSTKAALAVSHMRAGRRAEAEAVIGEMLAADPTDARALLLAAESRMAARDVDGARARLGELIAAAPQDPTGHVALARLALALGDAAEADRVLAESLAVVSDQKPVRLLKAQLFETRGEFDAAIEEYEKLYEVDPDSTVVANNLASLLAEHREADPESLRRAAQVARRLRGSAVPHFQDTYGWTLFLSGETEEAIRYLSQAAEDLPNNAIVRYHAGRAYAALGRTELAREHLEAALTLDPGFPKADSATRALQTLSVAPAAGAASSANP